MRKVQILLFLVSLLSFLTPTDAQYYGVPNFVVDGNMYGFVYSDGSFVAPDGTVYAADIYTGGYFYPGSFVLYDSGGNPVDYTMVGADGYTPLGSSDIIILSNDTSSGFWNGFAYVSYWAPGAGYIQTGASPFYWYDGNPGFVLDKRNGWPPSNAYLPPVPPSQVYVNGVQYNGAGTTISAGGASYSQTTYYQGPANNYVEIQENAYNDGPAQSFIWGTAGSNGETFSSTLDPSNWSIGAGVASDLAITFNAPGGTASYGPPMVSWDGNLLRFYYTTSDGKDLYWNAGDANGDYTVIIAQDDSVVAIHGTISVTGSCDPSTLALNFGGAMGTSNLFAQDAIGNPLGLPAGLTVLVGTGGFGDSILLSNGTHSPTYTYRRPDLSWGKKYVGLPSNYWFLVADNAGNYNSQLYITQDGEMVVNATSGWPLSNAYPTQIYVNGVACPLHWDTNYVGGTGQNTSGGASYISADTTKTIILSWAWSGGATWAWSMNSHNGAWNYGGAFSNVPTGTSIHLDPPPTAPSYGPARLKLNGTELTFLGLASQDAGADVYDGGGKRLTITSGGGVTVADDSTGNVLFTGFYNQVTHAINFWGPNAGTIATMDGAGNVLATTGGAAIASGLQHNLALKSDGTVWSWGYNGNGELGNGNNLNGWYPWQITSLSSIIGISAGDHHSLAVKSDGTIWTWGLNSNYQLGDGTTTSHNAPIQLSSLSGMTAVAAGGGHSLALKSDGTVWAWGYNGYGQLGDGATTTRNTPVQVTGLSGAVIVAIAAGQNFSMALDSNGNVWAWGYNGFGQLGDGSSTNRSTPVRAGSSLTGVTAISAGSNHSVALKSNGSVWVWGYGGNGQLGNGTTGSTNSSPVQVTSLTGISAITAGENHTVAVGSTGAVYACGLNANGQLGDGTTTQRTSPVQVSSVTNGSSVTAGNHTLLMTTGGDLLTWGTNAYGQLGNGGNVDQSTPGGVLSFTFGSKVATPSFAPEGGYYRQSGNVTVNCTTAGATIYYTLDGSDPNQSSATIAAGATLSLNDIFMLRAKAFAPGMEPSDTHSAAFEVGAKAVAGTEFTMTLKPDGTVWSWGHNNYGQLGNGSTADLWYPAPIPNLSGIQSIAAGDRHALAVKADGTVWAWGFNAYGQVGDGSTTQRNAPVQVGSLSGVVAVAGGYLHSLALKSDGTVWAWGYNGNGEVGDGTTTSRLSPVQVSGLTGVIAITAGSEYSAALKADGTVWTWGYNGSGRQGNGSLSSFSSPVRSGMFYNVVAIAAGQSHMIVLKGDGTVWGAGNNSSGQLGDGTTSTRTTPVRAGTFNTAIAVAAGYAHSAAVLFNGQVLTWGANNYGQLGDGTTTNRSSPVVAQGFSNALSVALGNHTVVTGNDGGIYGWGYNGYGQLGDGTNVNRTGAVPAANLTTNSQVALPALSPDGGAYLQSQTVTVTCSTPSAVLHYTMNGNVPTESDPTIASGGTLTSVTGLLRVKAFLASYAPSQTKSALYQIGGQIAGGQSHSLAVALNGVLSTWGSNATGQLGVGNTVAQGYPIAVTGLPGVAYAAGGYGHSAAIKSDGTLWTWGANTYGQIGDGTTTQRNSPVQVTGFTTTIAVAAGANHTLAVNSDGTVSAWGLNSNGQLGDGTTTQRTSPVQVPGLSGVIAVAAGSNFSMALQNDGSLWTWGYNGSGQLGNGGSNSTSSPTRAGTVFDVVAISAGDSHAMAIKADGTVWTWGLNSSGQLGDGSLTTRYSALPLSNITEARAIAAGQTHSLAVSQNGTLYTWGSNGYGLVPTVVPGLTTAVKIGAGYHTLAACADGSVIGFGKNDKGQVGDATVLDRMAPVAVVRYTLASPVDLPSFSPQGGAYASAQTVTVSCTTSGAEIHYTTNGAEPALTDPVIASGSTLTVNSALVLRAKAFKTGLAPSYSKSAAYQIGYQLMAGDAYSGVIAPGGGVWVWGNNANGQLGLGDTTNRTAPTQLTSLSGVAQMAACDLHTLAVMTDGTVRAWGNNGSWQLGDGTTTQRTSPITISGLSSIVQVSAGENHSIALKSDGSVLGWGSNTSGQIGDGSTTNRSTPVSTSSIGSVKAVAAGGYHTVALKTDGTVWCWGSNSSGQIGDGTTTTRTTAVQATGLTGVIAIAAGPYYSMALEGDGSVWVWGDNSSGQLGINSTTSSNVPVRAGFIYDAVGIAAGRYHTVGLRANGTPLASGTNTHGQLGNGTTTSSIAPVPASNFSNAISVAAGEHTLAAQMHNGTPVYWSWGENNDGQLGLGAAASDWAWWYRYIGQWNIDVTADQTVPLPVTYAYLDSDGDGLPDWLEQDLGTNPFNADTNGDGIPDGSAYYIGYSLTTTFTPWPLDNPSYPSNPSDHTPPNITITYPVEGITPL